MAAPVSALTTVTPSGIGFTFFSDPTCVVGSPTTRIDAGTGFTSTWFSAPGAGPFNLTVSAPGLAGATQSVMLITRPNTLTFTAMPPNPLLAGLCFSATLQTRNGGAPAPVIANTAIPLTEAPLGGTRYYSDANCLLPITEATMLAGQFSTTFYVKAITGGAVTVTATSPFGVNPALTFNIIPAVRRGSCGFQAFNTFVDCNFTPAQITLNKTALIFQASSASDDPDYMLITCELANNGRVRCIRKADIPMASFAATIHWQTLELPAGLRVERSQGQCNNPPVTRTFPPVNPASTFVLKSLSTTGATFNDEDLASATLTNATTVTYDVGGNNCGNQTSFDIQVVELSGVSVLRGTVTDAGTIGTATTLSGLPVASANRAVLVQPRGNNLGAPICNRMLRADAPTATSLSFSRGAGLADGGCQAATLTHLDWERIDFGSRATVQALTVTLLPTISTLDVAIANVDVTRTVVFTSSQAASGQGNGETDYNAGQFIGEATARFELTSLNNVKVTRERSVGAGTFTFYVVQIEP